MYRDGGGRDPDRSPPDADRRTPTESFRARSPQCPWLCGLWHFPPPSPTDGSPPAASRSVPPPPPVHRQATGGAVAPSCFWSATSQLERRRGECLPEARARHGLIQGAFRAALCFWQKTRRDQSTPGLPWARSLGEANLEPGRRHGRRIEAGKVAWHSRPAYNSTRLLSDPTVARGPLPRGQPAWNSLEMGLHIPDRAQARD